MKIKTVTHTEPNIFDDMVNDLLKEGYVLGERSVLMATPKLAHYAQLVLPDPVPEPEQGDPVEALRCIRDFCKAMPAEKCLTPACPLFRWCHLYTEDGDSPSTWLVPGEEANQ